MNQKLLDYEKTLEVIRSCRTSKQNTIAYRMVWNYQRKHGFDSFVLDLFAVCDLNLSQILGNQI